MNEIFENLYEMTAFSNIIAEPQFLIMYAIAFVLLYLGIQIGTNGMTLGEYREGDQEIGRASCRERV